MMAKVPATMVVPHFVGESRIETIEKSVPEPGPGELLLRVEANVLCGSERYQFKLGSPVTPGHEVVGRVAAAGPATSTADGERGAVFLMDFCGACRSCQHRATNQCLEKRGDLGFTMDGGYGQYVVVHESTFFPIGDLPAEDGTLLLDVMGTGGHAIRRAQLVRPDIESVLIVGAGPIGLAVLGMARILLGPDVPVVITDLAPFRLELASRLGGLAVDVSSVELADAAREAGVAAPDVAFDTSGRTAAREAALDVIGQRGALVCVGHGGGLSVKVSPQLIASERAILGSEYFCYEEFADNHDLLGAHRDQLAPIITHRFGVDDLQEAFELFFSGEAGKVLIEQ